MKLRQKNRVGHAGNGYVEFKGYSVKITKKKVDLEQHFVVPWEMKVEKEKKIID